jgi:hypothetical protein
MMLDYHGIVGVPEVELRRILKTKPKGTHLANLLFLKEEIRVPITIFLEAWGKTENYMAFIKKKKGMR